jgi:hypothetical protein
MGHTIHKKKFTAVTSCTLTLGQPGGTDLLHLEMSRLVEEATQHVSKLLIMLTADHVTKPICGHSYHNEPLYLIYVFPHLIVSFSIRCLQNAVKFFEGIKEKLGYWCMLRHD